MLAGLGGEDGAGVMVLLPGPRAHLPVRFVVFGDVGGDGGDGGDCGGDGGGDGGDDGGDDGDDGSDGLSHIATDERMFVKETVVDDPGFGLPLSLSAVQPQDDAGVGGHNNQPETNKI